MFPGLSGSALPHPLAPHGGAVPSLLDATPPPVEVGRRPLGGGGGAFWGALSGAGPWLGVQVPRVGLLKWIESRSVGVLPQPYIPGGPQQRGQNFRAPSAPPYVWLVADPW